MTGAIINAIEQELKLLFESKNYTVLKNTQFDKNNIYSYALPCIVIGLTTADEKYHAIGGATIFEPNLNIDVYFGDLNQTLTDDNEDAYNILDEVGNYIIRADWQSQDMINAVALYSLKIIMNGQIDKKSLETNNGGYIVGYTSVFETISLNEATTHHAIHNPTSIIVEQLPETPSMVVEFSTLNFDKDADNSDVDLTTNTSWYARTKADWITVTPDVGKDNATINVAVLANTTNLDRTGTIAIKCPLTNLVKTIIVSQTKV